MTAKIIALACATSLLASATSAQPRPNCGAHSYVVERLAADYGEARQSIGMSADNTIVEIFASHETGTWTITVTRAGGPTCLVASGAGYQYLDEALPNTDSGA